MAKEEPKAKPKVKKPTALKRDLQNEKSRDANKAFKSKVRTALRHYEESVKTQNNSTAPELLKAVYSLMDKGVKKGIYKTNKANRTKERAFAKLPS